MDHKTYLQPSCFIGNFNLFKTKQKLYDYSTSGGVADLLGRTCKEAAEKITFLSPFGNSTVIQFKFLFSMILAVAEKYNMKLLTHNMLTSKCMKAVTTGYPLAIQARDVKVCTTSCRDCVIVHEKNYLQVSEVEFNQDFIARVIPKIDWDCLCRAAEQLGHLEDLPKVLH